MSGKNEYIIPDNTPVIIPYDNSFLYVVAVLRLREGPALIFIDFIIFYSIPYGTSSGCKFSSATSLYLFPSLAAFAVL